MTTHVRSAHWPLVAALAGMLAGSACAGRTPKPVPTPAPPDAPAAPIPPPTPTPGEGAPVPPPPSKPPKADLDSSSAVSAQEGYATYVARFFHGRTAANGERFDERQLVAAHRTLPFGSVVRVTNATNGRSVTVRIVDRGPYGKNYREGTIIDLSRRAAERLRMIRDGQVPARVEVLALGEPK